MNFIYSSRIRYCCLLLFTLTLRQIGFAQCSYLNNIYGNFSPNCPDTNIISCLYAGQTLQVVVITGNTYTFSTCSLSSEDTEISLFDANGVTLIDYNNDACACQSEIIWTSSFTGYLNVQLSKFPCQSDSVCIDMLVICNGSPMPPSPTGDCENAIHVCTNLNFSVQSDGFGFVNEIPTLGSVGNPEYYAYDSILSPWGTDHYGCLMSGELNTTWMIVNIMATGYLEFTFGGNGSQIGFYDWIMFPYNSSTCEAIPTGNYPPIRCNWNSSASGGTGLASTIQTGSDSANFEPPLAVIAGEQYIICMSNWSSIFTVVPLDFSGTAEVSCTPLPVELIDLKAHKHPEGDNHLEWYTASEINNKQFTVQRSNDGKSWNLVGEVKGNGNSAVTSNYEFHDLQPLHAINYYRILQIDFNGATVPYNMVSVDNTVLDTKILKITNLIGQEIPADAEGIQLHYYADGRVIKILKNSREH
jgi:hypothetical protein